MRTSIKLIKNILFLLVLIILLGKPVLSDDTCMFQVSADDVPPNIVLLLDNGAEMENIIWHDDYDNSIDYTPDVHADKIDNDGDGTTDEDDTTEEIIWGDASTTNGFTNEHGYTVAKAATNKYYLTPILADLTPDPDAKHCFFSSTNTFTINERAITLPFAPSTVAVDGVIDKAARFRYSKNYLNWLFYGAYAEDGSDLPVQSRFYFAKKAIFTVAELTQRQAYFGINAFTANANGASNVQPLGFVYDAAGNVDSSFVNTVNTLGTFDYSPLAEGLASVGGYYGSPSSGVVGLYCQKSFVIVITSGVSSEDQAPAAGSVPAAFSDYDGDDEGEGEGVGQIPLITGSVTIPKNINGSSYLDDVAYYLYDNDIVDYEVGFQNVTTYTIGFMGNDESNAYLINASNNGNGNLNLYNTSDKKYGKYHFEAEDPDALSEVLINAINAILSKTSSFTAPVVPVTRTTSGNRIYLAFFKPGEDNFWEGNVTKFGLSSNGEILNADESAATWPNGAIREDAVPYWATIDWADTSKTGVSNSARPIYTYLDSTTVDLTEFSVVNLTPVLLTTYDDATGPLELINIIGTFTVDDVLTGSDSGATATISLVDDSKISYSGKTGFFRTGEVVTNGSGDSGTIANAGTSEVINYIRGADVYDEDGDGDIVENRAIICGDPLHSEPAVVSYGDKVMVFFGANDGMLHAVNDEDGSEAWSFIPPDLLPKLKNIIEASGHQYYVDSSPAVLIKDYNKNGLIESADTVYLVCGERKGGTSYFALDITDPDAPKFLWRIAQTDGFPAATTTIAELGETWSDPQFGFVKTTAFPDGIDVVFLGGGYSEDNTKGKTILAINAATGGIVKEFTIADDTDMIYSIPSKIFALDRDYNGSTDKLYVGDMGGQIWRIGNFDAASFPDSPDGDEDADIDKWEIHKLFTARCNETDCEDTVDNDIDTLTDDADTSKFFYPPTVTLEKGYDTVFIGSGDRDDACNRDTYDALYAIKDKQEEISLALGDLVNADTTAVGYATPDLAGSDNGWYLLMEPGEKALAESVVFNKTLYATTFLPNDDPCVPGGYAKLYALDYLTGSSKFDLNGDDTVDAADASTVIGGGIPSKPVVIISSTGVAKLLISTSSTNPDEDSEITSAGVTTTELEFPDINFFLKWWKEIFD
jgi:type IV pilus assembly protein PilY1